MKNKWTDFLWAVWSITSNEAGNEWSWYAFAHFILQGNQCLMQLERWLRLCISNIMFSLPTLSSPNQDLLSEIQLIALRRSQVNMGQRCRVTFRQFPTLWIAVSYRIGNRPAILILCYMEPQEEMFLCRGEKLFFFLNRKMIRKLWPSFLVVLLFALIIKWWWCYLEVDAEDL